MNFALPPWALFAPLLFAATCCLADDGDGDGMEDTWETASGLNAQDSSDAFEDADGDRIPNLWEFLHATDPNSISDFPAVEAIVDGSKPSDPSENRYATLQEAYDALPVREEMPAIVDVKPGTYAKGVDGIVPKRVAWLARAGRVVLKGPASTMMLAHETVIDSFHFAGTTSLEAAAVAVRPHADLGDTVPEVRLVNCIINRRVSTGKDGAVINEGGDLWLVHCTVSGNAGVAVDGIANLRGSLHLVNSIVWNARSGRSQDLFSASDEYPVVIVNSILRGTEGAWGSDPILTMDGHLTKESLACIGRASVDAGAPIDLHGANRYEKGIGHADLGVEQWIDSDKDGLADWWEQLHFDNLDKNGAGAAGRGLSLDQAYRLGIVPAGSLLEGTLHAPSVRITFPKDESVVR